MTARRKAARAVSSESKTGAPVGDEIPIATLAPDPKNPRQMGDDARAGLATSLKTFGPLDIVFNLQTGELVSGHQRVAELKAAGAVSIRMIDQEWGYVAHPASGDRFWVRFVRWDETKQRIGNLVANSPELQGEFTAEAVEQARAVQQAAEAEGLQLDKLLKDLERQFKNATPPEGGSSDQSGALGDSWQIVITCTSEAHQRKLLARFEQEGLECRALI